MKPLDTEIRSSKQKTQLQMMVEKIPDAAVVSRHHVGQGSVTSHFELMTESWHEINACILVACYGQVC